MNFIDTILLTHICMYVCKYYVWMYVSLSCILNVLVSVLNKYFVAFTRFIFFLSVCLSVWLSVNLYFMGFWAFRSVANAMNLSLGHISIIFGAISLMNGAILRHKIKYHHSIIFNSDTFWQVHYFTTFSNNIHPYQSNTKWFKSDT